MTRETIFYPAAVQRVVEETKMEVDQEVDQEVGEEVNEEVNGEIAGEAAEDNAVYVMRPERWLTVDYTKLAGPLGGD